MITQEQLAASVWGTGYGSKKHLVDHETSKPSAATSWGYTSGVRARCSYTFRLDALDSAGADPRGLLSRRKPCVRCQKIADAEVSA